MVSFLSHGDHILIKPFLEHFNPVKILVVLTFRDVCTNFPVI